jgi:hypothetical protein
LLWHTIIQTPPRPPAPRTKVEKWQLLLHALGLEVATGRPSGFSLPKNRYYASRNAATAVTSSLSGAPAHDMLEKIAYLLLPSQSAFEGLLARQVDAAGHLHFKVGGAPPRGPRSVRRRPQRPTSLHPGLPLAAPPSSICPPTSKCLGRP